MAACNQTCRIQQRRSGIGVEDHGNGHQRSSTFPRPVTVVHGRTRSAQLGRSAGDNGQYDHRRSTRKDHVTMAAVTWVPPGVIIDQGQLAMMEAHAYAQKCSRTVRHRQYQVALLACCLRRLLTIVARAKIRYRHKRAGSVLWSRKDGAVFHCQWSGVDEVVVVDAVPIIR